MKDIVIVPTWGREEFRTVCLEHIFAAHGIENKEVWICWDCHLGDEFTEKRQSDGYVKYVYRNSHAYYGNSFNVLASLKEAYETGAERVYLIEDDVMVMEDFFLWHEAIQKAVPDAFVSIASSINKSLDYAINGPQVLDRVTNPLAYHVSDNAYSSIGVCFPRRTLLELLGLMSLNTYEKLAPGVEQDILIKKYMNRIHASSVWPYLPRCYHMGWYGYHRNTGLQFNGTIPEKVAALRAALTDQKKIDSMALAQNIEAIPTTPAERWWEKEDPHFYSSRKFK